MKRLILVLVVLALVLLWAVSASADLSGHDLQELCEATAAGEQKADATKYNECLFFLANVTAIPAWVSDEELRQVWLRYARKYPEELPWDAGAMTNNAVHDTYSEDIDVDP